MAELQQAEVMCQEVTWPIGGRVGAGPDGMFVYVLMCEFTHVFSHAGVGSSVNEYIVEARGLSQSPFLRHYLLSYFEIGSHWLGVQPLGESRWPVSLRDLCSPASSGLGLQVCAVTPDFYVGCLHHPLGPCVYPIGTSLTVLSPQPQVFCFCSFVGLFQATRQSEWGFQSVAASCT